MNGENADMNFAIAYRPTWLDRLRWKLFPMEICEIPDVPAKDCVIVRSTFTLSLSGRLRMLVSGRVEVETKTATENVVGECATSTCLNVRAPRFMERARSMSLTKGD